MFNFQFLKSKIVLNITKYFLNAMFNSKIVKYIFETSVILYTSELLILSKARLALLIR